MAKINPKLKNKRIFLLYKRLNKAKKLPNTAHNVENEYGTTKENVELENMLTPIKRALKNNEAFFEKKIFKIKYIYFNIKSSGLQNNTLKNHLILRGE